jgi:hypothetical protein
MSPKALRFSFLGIWVFFVGIVCGLTNWEFPQDAMLGISYVTASTLFAYAITIITQMMVKKDTGNCPRT